MITCPTCANRMLTYPDDWRVCLACAIFDHAGPDALESRTPGAWPPGAAATSPTALDRS